MTKASIGASSDKILKESSEMEMSETEGLRNAPKTILNLQHKLSIEEKEQALQQNSEKFIKKMFLREIYPKKRVQQRETLVPKAIQFDGNKYDGLSEGYIMGRGFGRGG